VAFQLIGQAEPAPMLTEWWTYRPHDFLMFSPRIYWRLFESMNAAGWPLALLATTGAGWGLWAATAQHRSLRARRGALGLLLLGLAAAWAWVAHAFLWQRLTPIFWAAEWAVWGFALQGLGWLGLAAWLWLNPGSSFEPDRQHRRVALAIGLLALLLMPLFAAATGRPWLQAELFALAPDPTVLFSLAVLLLLPRGLPRLLWLVPLAWCLFSAATLALLGSWQALVPVGAAVLALWAARRRATAPGR
jgi:hypothetical protein